MKNCFLAKVACFKQGGIVNPPNYLPGLNPKLCSILQEEDIFKSPVLSQRSRVSGSVVSSTHRILGGDVTTTAVEAAPNILPNPTGFTPSALNPSPHPKTPKPQTPRPQTPNPWTRGQVRERLVIYPIMIPNPAVSTLSALSPRPHPQTFKLWPVDPKPVTRRARDW